MERAELVAALRRRMAELGKRLGAALPDGPRLLELFERGVAPLQTGLLRLIDPPARDEFSSSAEQIENSSITPLLGKMYLTLVSMVVVAVLWSVFSQVDKVVVCTGALQSVEKTLKIQPLEKSVITSIPVRIGDFVPKGKVLATFDSTFAKSDVESLQSSVAQLRAKVERLTAESGGREYGTSSRAGSFELLERAVYLSRRDLYQSKVQSFESERVKLQKTIETAQNELKFYERQHGLAKEVLSMYSTLRDQEAISRLEYLSRVDKSIDTEREAARAAKRIIEARADLMLNRSNYNSFLSDWNKQLAEELVTGQTELAKAEESLNKALRYQDFAELRSPMDAVVVDIAKLSVGSVVQEVEPIMTLVAANATLQVEAMIGAADIGKVRIGDPVIVKVDAYPFTKHGSLRGVVEAIAEDTVESQDAGSDLMKAATGRGVKIYKARVSITENELTSSDRAVKLLPGMTVSAEVVVGRERIINFLLHPIFRITSEAMREPK